MEKHFDSNTEEGARSRIEQLVGKFLELDSEDMSLPSPRPGSSLDLDDAEFPILATSHVVQLGIMAAREHLLSAGLLWRSHEGGTLLPSAYSTLVRAAVIGAGTALWILHPAKRAERLQRTISYAVENFRHALVVQTEALEQAPRLGIESLEVIENQRRSVARAADRLELARRAQWDAHELLGPYEPRRLPKFEQTAVLADAAKYAYRDSDKLPIFSRFLWRTSSGDAHGLMWPKILRSIQTGEHERAVASADGATWELRDTNTCESLLPLLADAALIHASAERLYELRRLTYPAC